jgi:3-hydroxyisobutyrate dehydrogenase-like beta-hydroxyacid dehydrogenase
MTALDYRRIALIGFGEVGTMLATGLTATGRYDIAVYDILLDDAQRGPAMRDRARALRVEACASVGKAVAGAKIVISAVTAASSRDVAETAARSLKSGHLFLDLNSVSPETKRASAAAVDRSGAHYVEAAVMAAVAPYGLKVPMLLGGRHAAELKALLDPAGMALTIAATEIGRASAIKMSRSIMIKGLEALAMECLLTARHYGVEDDVIATLERTYPQIGWEKQMGYLISRSVEHGRRRAAEMRESAGTVEEAGIEPLMASAIARRQDWVADRAAANPALKTAPESAWRETLDRIAADAAAPLRKAAP